MALCSSNGPGASSMSSVHRPTVMSTSASTRLSLNEVSTPGTKKEGSSERVISLARITSACLPMAHTSVTLVTRTVKISSLALCSMSMSAEQSVENSRPRATRSSSENCAWPPCRCSALAFLRASTSRCTASCSRHVASASTSACSDMPMAASNASRLMRRSTTRPHATTLAARLALISSARSPKYWPADSRSTSLGTSAASSGFLRTVHTTSPAVMRKNSRPSSPCRITC
mmetsp:Transcript_28754/g.73193  ORF Transcript_28754/g.73193 Transcript_28754/m.73193 type:complete len:231 (-) Transcript_28754:2088-2780(-)